MITFLVAHSQRGDEKSMQSIILECYDDYTQEMVEDEYPQHLVSQFGLKIYASVMFCIHLLQQADTNSMKLTFSRLMTYICRAAPLTSRCCILYIYSTNIRTEYFKHAAHSLFFPLQNAVYFIMLPFLVPVLFTFSYRMC